MLGWIAKAYLFNSTFEKKTYIVSTDQFAKLFYFYHRNIPVLLELHRGACHCGNCLLGKEALIIIFYNYYILMVKLLSAPMHLIMQFLSIHSFP